LSLHCFTPTSRSASLALLLLTLAASLLPSPAAAHAILIASQPREGGSVPAGKVAIHLQYNSRIDRARSRLTLTSPDRSQATLPIAAAGAPDEMNTAATLTPGAYVLRWQVLAIDGHITRGDVTFNVGP
jgi:copper resistance protein C